MIRIKFGDNVVELSLTSEGFKIKWNQSINWEYVKREHIVRLAKLLNNTFGYKGQYGRFFLNIPLNQRDGVKFTRQRGIFKNTAFVLMLLYPDIIKIDGSWVISSGKIHVEKYNEKYVEFLKKSEESESVLDLTVDSKNAKNDVVGLTQFIEK